MTARCPQCTGQRMARHPAGLTFDHTNTCALRDQEDATRVADGDLVADGGWDVRDTSDTEQTLLIACGAPADRIPARTIVSAVTGVPYPTRRTDGRGVPEHPSGDSVALVRRSWLDPVTRAPLDPDQLDPITTEEAAP